MTQTVTNIGWSIVFTLIGGLVGMLMVLAGSVFVPRLMAKLTPAIDEEKEIIRGNLAVAEYFGRIVGASIIGLSIVIAAAVLGGVISALH